MISDDDLERTAGRGSLNPHCTVLGPKLLQGPYGVSTAIISNYNSVGVKEMVLFKGSQENEGICYSLLQRSFHSNEPVAFVASPGVWVEVMLQVCADIKPTGLVLEYLVGHKKADGTDFSLLSMANDP